MALRVLSAAAVAAVGLASLECQDGQDWSQEVPGLSLLQLDVGGPGRQLLEKDVQAAAKTDPGLVLMHLPYNFGHTLESVAMFGSGGSWQLASAMKVAGDGSKSVEERLALLEASKQPNGEVWGHVHPLLQETSNVTGCPLYFTPGKHWPKEIAEAYFQDKTRFGMLRDPYERLVAQFRGNYRGYGGQYDKFYETCDVNGAVRQMVETVLSGDPYAEGCTWVPQAEYFDAPYGIMLPVDNRRFPNSANEMLVSHGYSHMFIQEQDILHVSGCNEVWAGDLDCETKALVKKVYARDFELLCKHFGYCDDNENCCLLGVPEMCPSNLTAKRETATYCSE
eukprot:gb/GFBE01082235.1/.p1 GENE.gb/GFBE01082235.1/~~gb/GFBE01082235.1/.p1  ORF type:complete len:337 (+),score=73.45 gb/GFBE01082235.1/:1-1011(+)